MDSQVPKKNAEYHICATDIPMYGAVRCSVTASEKLDNMLGLQDDAG